MAEYKLIEEKKKGLLSKQMKRRLPLLIVAIIAGLFISFFQTIQTGYSNIIVVATLLSLLFCGGGVFIGLKFGLKIYRENHLDIIFSIENNVINIIKKGKTIISVTSNDIDKIEQYPDESIFIFLKNKQRIVLNKNIENYHDMINEIDGIVEINKADKKPKNIIYKIFSILIIVMLIVFNLSTNKIAIISSGIFVIAIIAFSMIKTLTNKSLDKRIKLMFLAVLLVLFDVIKKILAII